jgi:ribosomal protein L37AE/L43A
LDLFDCPGCEQRFIARDAGDGDGWSCPRCGSELNLVVRRLPGSAQAIATALDATILSDLEDLEDLATG